MERSASQRASSNASQPTPTLKKPPQYVDLFGDMPEPAPAQRSNSAAAAPSRTFQAPPSSSAPQKPAKTGDSLLGFDFFGPSNSNSNPPSRPSSAAASVASSGMPSRPDLKQSILSLYARAPDNTLQHSRTTSGSAGTGNKAGQGSSGGLDDAFSGLSFSSPPPQSPPVTSPKPSQFSNITSPTSSKPPVTVTSSSKTARPPSIGTGTFFDAKPVPKQSKPVETSRQPPTLGQPSMSSSDAFGDFGDFTSSEPAKPSAPVQSSSTNGMGDIFSAPSPQPAASFKTSSQPASSPFNLSAPKPASTSQPPPQTSSNNNVGNAASMVSMDPWGSGNVWAASNTAGALNTSPPSNAPFSNPPPKSNPVTVSTATDFGGWGSSAVGNGGSSSALAPKATADEDFGGWESSTVPIQAAPSSAAPTAGTSAPKSGGGLGGAEDLFSNVWE